jgi:hypothetical protein
MMKTVCRLLVYPIVFAAAFMYLGTAQAVVIEGVTPSGKFKSVFVTEAGRLPIEISTGAAQHVIVDSGTITAFQGGAPWAVTTAVGVAVTVAPSTSAVTVNDQFSVSGASSNCYPADSARKQGVICNSSESVNIYIGGPGVGTGTGAILGPGSCYSPDVPTAFVGPLSCISTAPASGFYIYGK